MVAHARFERLQPKRHGAMCARHAAAMECGSRALRDGARCWTERRRGVEDMILAGLAEGTQMHHDRAIRQLTAYYWRTPDQFSEEGLTDQRRPPSERQSLVVALAN
jgi:hypothetical protein